MTSPLSLYFFCHLSFEYVPYLKDLTIMKEFRCFIENASLASPDTNHVAPIYELSEEGRTFAKYRERRAVKGDDRNVVHSFHVDQGQPLTDEETRLIINVANSFVAYLESVIIENKNEINAGFVKYYNNTASNKIKLVSFSYNAIVKIEAGKFPDYFSFTTSDITCSVWLSDTTFKLFYQLYDIDVVTPFEEFDDVIRNPTEMLKFLGEFDLKEFAIRCDDKKNGIPSTYTRNLNVPYRPRKDLATVPCWFGFNIYGAAGDYEHLMRDELYNHLKDLGLDDEFIEDHFPSIFEVNEFTVIPLWDRYALPFKTGQGSVNSQISKAFTEKFDIPNYIKFYEGKEKWMEGNTYDVPFAFNNILTRVVNGYYTQKDSQDFLTYYPDLITVSSTSPDFARMSTKTQRFLIVTNHMFNIADAKDQTELFNKIMINDYMLDSKKLRFSIASRRGVVFLSIFYDDHRYFMIPRYEFERIGGVK